MKLDGVRGLLCYLPSAQVHSAPTSVPEEQAVKSTPSSPNIPDQQTSLQISVLLKLVPGLHLCLVVDCMGL